MNTSNRPTSNRILSTSWIKLFSILTLSLLIIAGCGNSQKEATSSPSAPASEADNIVEPTVTESIPITEETATSPESNKATEHDSSANDTTDSAASISATNILDSAQKGTLPDLPEGLTLGSSRETLFKLKGKPELGSTDDLMLSYGGFDVSFDSKDKIVEMTSGAAAYKNLKMNTIITEIGKPDETNNTSKDTAYTAEAIYHLSNSEDATNYSLTFSYNTKTQKVQYVRLYVNSQ